MGVMERKKRTDKKAFAFFFFFFLHSYGKITLLSVMFSEILTLSKVTVSQDWDSAWPW